jgi:hypothetical protein
MLSLAHKLQSQRQHLLDNNLT